MQDQAYNIFFQKIHTCAKDKGLPLRVMFELTYRCNFNCGHCYVPFSYRKKTELKTNEIFSILEQLKAIGCLYLGFTGGEPLVREDFLDILRYAKKCGFEIIIYTNGSLINKEVAKQLGDIKPNEVDITIPAMNESTFRAVTGIPGSRDKLFEAIELLSKAKINLGFKTCVLEQNEDEIGSIQEFSRSLGARHRLDNILSRRLDGSPEPYKYRGSLKGLVTKNKIKINSEDHQLWTMDLFKCGVGASQAAITPQGELKMCVMIDYPKFKILDNGKKSSLKNSWERLKELVSNIKLDEKYRCPGCRLQSYCKRCPADSWLSKKSFTGCDQENRNHAELLRFKVTKNAK